MRNCLEYDLLHEEIRVVREIHEEIRVVRESLHASYEALTKRVARLENQKACNVPVCYPVTQKDEDDFRAWVNRDYPSLREGSVDWMKFREAFLAARRYG